MTRIHKIYRPSINFALRHPRGLLLSVVTAFVLSTVVMSSLGGEFIPQLEEGDLAAGLVTLQGSSLSNTIEQVKKANKILRDSFPEVKHAVCKIGTGETPTDPMPMETGDYVITLRPKSEWTSAKTREELVDKMQKDLSVLPGVKFEFQQPIQMRTNELLSGSKQDISIKIFGDDISILAQKAAEVDKIIRKIDGVKDINVEKITGLEQIQVEYNRRRLAQYGISVADANKVLKAAIAGSTSGIVFDGDKRFDMVVRLDSLHRGELQSLKSLNVALPNGMQIPLEQIADIGMKSGPSQISRENARRRVTIGFNVRNRDVQSVIEDVSTLLDNKLNLPEGYYVTYGGQFKNLEAAKQRLAVVVPLSLLLIFVLLYFAFHSIKQAFLIYSAVPMALIGGVFSLWMRGMNFSISAGVGFIALFGIAVLNGIVLVSEFNALRDEGEGNIYKRVLKGVSSRLRPVMMTATVASLGFLPMAISTSAGAEVQKPLATVVIGGLVTSTLLTLLVLPVLYIIFSKTGFRKAIRSRLRIKNATKALPLAVLAAFFAATPILSSAKAQQPVKINLRQAVQTALSNNLYVKAADYGIDAAKCLRWNAADLPMTQLSGEYGNMNSEAFDNSFSVSQSFNFPTLYVDQSRLAKANIKASSIMAQQARLEVSTRVKQTYGKMAYLHAEKQLLHIQDSLFEKLVKVEELREKAGETDNLQTISARSNLMEVKNSLRRNQENIALSRSAFATLLNTSACFDIADTLSATLFGNIAFSDTLGVDDNPQMKNALSKCETLDIQRKIETDKMLPQFSLGVTSATIKGTQDVDDVQKKYGANDRFNSMQFGLAVPLWFLPGLSNVKAAKIKAKSALVEAESLRQQLKAQYAAAIAECGKKKRDVAYYQQQAVPQAKLIIHTAKKNYEAGNIEYSEYLLSLRQAIQIMQSCLDAIDAYNQSVIALDLLVGKTF